MVIAFSGFGEDVSAGDNGALAGRIQSELTIISATLLVASPLRYADLVALEVAGGLQIRRTVVLPFARDTFRDTYVLTHYAHAAARFDAVMDEVKSAGDVIVLGHEPDDAHALPATLDRVLAEARTSALGLADTASAMLAGVGKCDGNNELEQHFLREAELANVPVIRMIAG